jgi:hypothetical protein
MSLADKSDRKEDQPPLWQRLFFAIPVVGWIARDLIYGDSDTIWYLLAMLVSLWAISVMTFGVPGLYIPAVILAPIVFLVLLIITWG